MTDVSDNKYSPDQVFSNDQIDELRKQVTWCGGSIADEIYWEGYSESPLSIGEKQILTSKKRPKGFEKFKRVKRFRCEQKEML